MFLPPFLKQQGTDIGKGCAGSDKGTLVKARQTGGLQCNFPPFCRFLAFYANEKEKER